MVIQFTLTIINLYRRDGVHDISFDVFGGGEGLGLLEKLVVGDAVAGDGDALELLRQHGDAEGDARGAGGDGDAGGAVGGHPQQYVFVELDALVFTIAVIDGDGGHQAAGPRGGYVAVDGGAVVGLGGADDEPVDLGGGVGGEVYLQAAGEVPEGHRGVGGWGAGGHGEADVVTAVAVHVDGEDTDVDAAGTCGAAVGDEDVVAHAVVVDGGGVDGIERVADDGGAVDAVAVLGVADDGAGVAVDVDGLAGDPLGGVEVGGVEEHLGATALCHVLGEEAYAAVGGLATAGGEECQKHYC